MNGVHAAPERRAARERRAHERAGALTRAAHGPRAEEGTGGGEAVHGEVSGDFPRFLDAAPTGTERSRDAPGSGAPPGERAAHGAAEPEAEAPTPAHDEDEVDAAGADAPIRGGGGGGGVEGATRDAAGTGLGEAAPAEAGAPVGRAGPRVDATGPAGGREGVEPGTEAASPTDDTALIDVELAEHERWAGSFGELGTARSDERAAFLLSQVSAGASSGLSSGLGMGLVMGAAGGALGQLAGRRLATLAVSRGATAVPVPGLGPAIGGVMAVVGLAMRDWDSTFDTIGRFGTGEGYEGLANDLEGLAEALDLACSIMDVVAGVCGTIAVGMWVGTVLSGGTLAPLALTLSAIGTGIGIATAAVGVIINVAVRPAVTALRALHSFQSQADPATVEADAAQLQAAAAQVTGAVGGAIGGRLGGAAGGRLGTRAERMAARMAARRGGRPAMSARAGPGPRVHAEMPAGPRSGASATPRIDGPAAPRADAAPSTTARPAGDGPVAASPRRLPPSELRPLAAPLRLAGIRGNEPVPRGLARGAIGTYGRAVANPHPAALRSNPPGAPGATRRGGRAPRRGRTRAGVYLEHQTPARAMNRVLPGHRYNSPSGRRRGGRDVVEALTIATPRRAKPFKDAADAALDASVSRRLAAGEDVSPVEVITEGTRNLNDAVAASGETMPGSEISRNFLAEMDQFHDPRFGYTEVRSGDSLPPGHPLAGLPDADVDAFVNRTFDPFIDADAPAARSPARSPDAAPLPAASSAPRYAPHTETVRTRDRAAAMAQYHEQIRLDPGRESGVWAGPDGTYYVMQGDGGSVSPPSAGGPLRLVYHSHPTDADVSMRGLVSQPSQANGDFGVLAYEHATGGPAGRRIESELHFPTYDGDGNHSGFGATRFAYDPTSPLPLQVTTTLPGGAPTTQRYASFADFEARTGIAAGGDTPAASGAARVDADTRLSADRAAAGRAVDATTEGLLGTRSSVGAREGRDEARTAAGEPTAGLPAGPEGYAVTVAGLAPGESIELPVNPAYPPPPGTPEQLDAFLDQVDAARAAQEGLAATADDMAAQAETESAHADGLSDASGVVADLASGRDEHAGAVAETSGANADMATRASEAYGALANGARETTGVATLVTSLQAFRGMAHLFSYLPGSLGRSAEGARDDAGELMRALGRVGETDGAQAGVGEGQAVIEADAGRLEAVEASGAETDVNIDRGGADLAQLEADNAASLARTASVRDLAHSEGRAAAEHEADAQAGHDSLLADLQAWADQHRQARQDAIDAAMVRCEAEGLTARVLEA